MTTRALLALALFGAPLAHAADDLTDFLIAKRAVYFQDASGTPNTPLQNAAFLDFSFQIAPGTIFYYNAISPQFHADGNLLPYSTLTNDYLAGFDVADSTSALDSRYPVTANHIFSTSTNITLSGSAQGSFFGLASYSYYVPRLSNYTTAQVATPGTSFTVQLFQNATGPEAIGFDNYISLTLFDPADLSVAYEGPQESKTDLFHTLPGSALASGENRLLRVRFVSPASESTTTPPHDYPVLANYLRETWLTLKTFNAVSFDATHALTWSSYWTQTGPQAPTLRASQPHAFNASLTLNQAKTLDAVNLHQIATGESFPLTQDPDNTRTYTYTDNDAEGYAGGRFAFGFRPVGEASRLLWGDWWQQDLDGIEINNWDACQAVQSRRGTFTVKLPALPYADGDISQAQVALYQVGPGEQPLGIVTSPVGGDWQTLRLSTSTLTPETTYAAKLTFAPEPESDDSPLDTANQAITEFTFTTGPTTWEDVAVARLIRGAYFDNGNGLDTPANPITFRADLTEDVPAALTAVTLRRDLNGTTPQALTRADGEDDRWQLDEAFADEAAREAAWPDGFYRFAATRASDGLTQGAQVELGASSGAFPATQVDTSLLTLGQLDPSLPIPLAWTGFAATGAGDSVTWEAYDATFTTLLASGTVESIAADGHSGVIPANVLAADTEYRLRVGFRETLAEDELSFTDATLLAVEENWTLVPLTTGPAVFGTWLSGYLSPDQLADPAYADPLANPELDRLSNLLEFALNGNPLAPDLLPLPALSSDRLAFVYQFQRRVDSPLLSYQVRHGDTLPTLTPYAGTLSVITPGTPYETVEARFDLADAIFVDLLIRANQASE